MRGLLDPGAEQPGDQQREQDGEGDRDGKRDHAVGLTHDALEHDHVGQVEAEADASQEQERRVQKHHSHQV